MALYKFAKAIVEGRTIDLHEGGRMSRDFTYIDDVTAAILALLDHVPVISAENADHRPDISHVAAHRVFNVGNDRPVKVSAYLAVLEECLGIQAKIREVPMTSGEVLATWADISALKAAVGYAPQTPIEQGIAKFADWFRAYHKV